MIHENEAIWFVHLEYEPPLPLRFQRTANLGAEVTGGKTGSHATGHGETYWDKLAEVIKLGYMPVSIAKEIGRLDDKWMQPDTSKLDASITRGDYKLRS
jgi:hypothetical protein